MLGESDSWLESDKHPLSYHRGGREYSTQEKKFAGQIVLKAAQRHLYLVLLYV